MANKTAYERVTAARSPKKMTTDELISGLISNFFELHGDRSDGDDQAVIGGVGRLNDQRLRLWAFEKAPTRRKISSATLAVRNQKATGRRCV